MQLVISAGQVLTGPAGHRCDHGAVLIEGSSIMAVGAREDIRAAAPHATEFPYPTATIIPGLINAHVHLAFDPGPHRLERLLDNRELPRSCWRWPDMPANCSTAGLPLLVTWGIGVVYRFNFATRSPQARSPGLGSWRRPLH